MAWEGDYELRNGNIITAHAYIATGGYVLLNFPPWLTFSGRMMPTDLEIAIGYSTNI